MKVLWLALLVVSWAASGAQVGNLTGIVRDDKGAPIAGARVSISSESSQLALSMTSDAQGAYHFFSLPAGGYSLQTTDDGFATNSSVAVSIAAGADVSMPVTLRRSPLAARPQFEAAGVRGLIDPGGYSASSNAAAASGLISGVGDIARTDNNATATNAGCALEPGLQRNLKENPQSADANLKLGEFYLAHQQEAKAILLLEHARRLNGNDQDVLEELADAYLRTKQFDVALQLLSSARDQKRPAINRLLARAEEGTGKFIEASHAYQLASDANPSEENLFGVGYELILAGMPRDAERAFASGVMRVPRSLQLLIGLGSAQFLTGRAAESIQTLLRAVDLDPADPRPYAFLSEASSTAHDEGERVRAAFEQFLTIAPDSPQASYYLARMMLQEPAADELSQHDRIEALLKRAMSLNPDLPDAHFQLGVLYAREGEYQAAAQEFEKEIRIAPNLKDAHYRLAVAYRQTGQVDLSAKEMQRFRELQQKARAEKSGMGSDIDQFISVLGKPLSAKAGGSLCPGDSP